jgi:hypothetical protein
VFESLGQSAIPTEHDRPGECCGSKALGAQQLRKRLVDWVQRRTGIISDAMCRREQSREQAAVRRQCQGRDRQRLIEDYPVTREPIEMRLRPVHETICRQAVHPCRIERDNDNAGWRSVAIGDAPPHDRQRRACDRE